VLSTPYVDGFKVSALLFGSVAQGAAGAPVTAHLPLVHGFSDAADGDAEAAGGAAASSSSASALLLREVALTLDGSVSAALAPSTPAPTSLASAGAPYPLTRWGFRDGLEALTPEDFSTLQRCVKEECPNPSVKHLLALLRLANHDAEVFYKFKQVLIDKSAYPQVHDNLARDLRGDVDRVYASHFPLVPSKDVSFELGRMLMGLRDYASAIEFFNKSHETCGAHHITVRSWRGGGRGGRPRGMGACFIPFLPPPCITRIASRSRAICGNRPERPAITLPHAPPTIPSLARLPFRACPPHPAPCSGTTWACASTTWRTTTRRCRPSAARLSCRQTMARRGCGGSAPP